MKYKTLTAIGLVVALVVGFAGQAVVYAVLAPGSMTDFVATVIFPRRLRRRTAGFRRDIPGAGGETVLQLPVLMRLPTLPSVITVIPAKAGIQGWRGVKGTDRYG